MSAGDPDRDLARLEALLSRQEGRRDALRRRVSALTGEVELAKGRLALKGEVETFIEAAHAAASRRNLSAFETLLTALVQEVLPGEKPVSLDLSTERGLPSLDVNVQRPDGTLEDVLEDNGGALTNVIGMALRLIAVVKADAGRFLALDEADCWIAPERVPAFYRVLEDGAARLGVQCLAVSHHDLSGFAGQFHVSRVTGDPVSGVGIAAADLAPAWDEAQPGLRFIRLLNVQAYADATLRLSPGVNALVGPNNRGKSTFIRALRAVFYGEARDSLVRAGAKSATVEIGLAGGRTLRFSRQPRRNPVNLWSLHEPDGGVVEERGIRHETGGRTVPDWVDALCRITKVEELDVHIAHQKFPVFLLGEAPSRRSAVLSIGQEAGYIRDMLAIHRERCRRDADLVKAGERELIEADASLRALEGLDALRAELGGARERAAALRDSTERLAALDAQGARLLRLREALGRAAARLDASVALPDPERVAALRSALDEARERERAGQRLAQSARALRLAQARSAVLAGCPQAAPVPETTAEAERALGRMTALGAAIEAAQARLAAAEAGLAVVRADMAGLVDATGGRCPTCGSSVDAETLLDHGHAASQAAA
ncbi:MAG TPA: AAA family ATPase [Microvirga sp.]|nr:AAA family ATPase [Microvirga sp.]